MRAVVVLTSLAIVSAVAWLIGSRLSTDALGMAVGMSFGVMAGVPAALLVLAAGRRHKSTPEDDEEETHVRRLGPGYAGYPQQGPVIVLAPPAAPWPPQQQPGGYGQQPVRGALPGPSAPLAAERVYRMVGERDELIEDF